jgi:hypothetical protein
MLDDRGLRLRLILLRPPCNFVGFVLPKFSRRPPCCKKVKRKSAPVCELRARGSPSFFSSHLPLVEGDGAPTRRWPGSPGRRLPGFPSPGVKRHAPRLAARQRGILGSRVSQRSGHARSSVSLAGFSRGRPWIRIALLPARRLPLPIPALKTPHENVLDDGSG